MRDLAMEDLFLLTPHEKLLIFTNFCCSFFKNLKRFLNICEI